MPLVGIDLLKDRDATVSEGLGLIAQEALVSSACMTAQLASLPA
jgi:hypothetical protein